MSRRVRPRRVLALRGLPYLAFGLPVAPPLAIEVSLVDASAVGLHALRRQQQLLDLDLVIQLRDRTLLHFPTAFDSNYFKSAGQPVYILYSRIYEEFTKL